MKKTVIIVAGGKGSRFGSDIPKQFLLLSGRPVLMSTIEQFVKYDKEINIILVLPSDQIDYWGSLCLEYKFELEHKIVSGGETRFQSVKNGLLEITIGDLVAVHDGVRPLVSIETISRTFEAAVQNDAVIPVMDPVDSIREISELSSKPVDRNNYKLVQTPQVFKANVLLQAYNQEFIPEFTDDASVVEKAGFKVTLVEGNCENIKITSKKDLTIAEALMRNRV